MLSHLQKLDELPTAFLPPMIRLGAIAALQSLGYKVPGDISIGGFDDVPVASFTEPKLTTIIVPKFDIGRLAVSTLLNKIKKRGAQLSHKSVLIGQPIFRQSTAPAPR